MHVERRILANTVLLGGGEFVGQLTNFVVVVGLARAFGADVFGHYSVSMAVGALAALLVGLGTQPLLIRELSREPSLASSLLGIVVPVQLALGAAAWLLASLLCLLLIGQIRAIPVIAAICASQILLRLAVTLLAPFQAIERMRPAVVGQLIQRLLTLVLALLAIGLGASAGTVTLAFVAGAISLWVFAWVSVSRQFGPPSLELDWDAARRLFRRASPFLGLSTLGVIYTRSGLIMLAALASPEAVGLYAVADRLMVAVALVPGVFNSALFPALSRLTRQDIVRARALVNGSLRLLMVVTVPLAALISLFAAEICGLMFGVHFIEAASALHLLAWSLPARGLLWLTGSQLTALDQQASMARGRSVSLVVFLLATPGLIWAFGFAGVACGVLISDGLQLLLYWRALRRVDQVPSLGKPLLGPVLASLAMLGASYFAMEHSPVVRVPVAVITMMAGLWVFGAVRVRDFEFLRAMLRSRMALAEGGLPARPGAGSPPS